MYKPRRASALLTLAALYIYQKYQKYAQKLTIINACKILKISVLKNILKKVAKRFCKYLLFNYICSVFKQQYKQMSNFKI